MEYLVTAEEMKKYDENAIERIGIPDLVLMERAALCTCDVILNFFETGEMPLAKLNILILAGTGNNGADGLALGRLLCDRGVSVDIFCPTDMSKVSPAWQKQSEILKKYGMSVVRKMPDKEYNIIVDAIFGIGLNRDIDGQLAEVIEKVNIRDAKRLAMDIPTGIHADTGRVMGCAFRADITVTYGFVKRGLVLRPGLEYAGKVVKADIGISEKCFFDSFPQMYYYNESVTEMLPLRAADGHKGTFGKVLLIAGSVNMAGAAVLAAKAAYRIGAGMVKILSSKKNRVIIQESIPEALFGTPEQLESSLLWADIVIIGPGIGTRPEAKMCLKKVITKSSLPLVLDADALNLLAEDEQLQRLLSNRQETTVITPHVAELSRLMNIPVLEVQDNLYHSAMALAGKFHVTVVAKSSQTYICEENHPTCLNIYGNSGMGTAGAGDVLAGIIGGLMGQGVDGYHAAAQGVFLHAKAGDAVRDCRGEHFLMAGDIVEKLGQIR
jgi:NAD(P)H-hydrate epimerase